MVTTAEFQARAAKAMTEAVLRDRHIRPLAAPLGWRVQFTWRSDHSPSGFPDLLLLHPRSGSLLWRELKRVGKRPTAAQQAWLDDLALHGYDAAVWTPADWFSGRIRGELLAAADLRRAG